MFILLIAGAVVMGIAGGTAVAATLTTAHAHGGARWGGSGSGDGTSLAARIAEKLNDALELDEDITEAQVQTAFNGVTADRQVEKLEARIDELDDVEEATRTEILDWFDDYPYADLIRFRTIGLASSDNVSAFLERLVEKERITQAQSDGIQGWYEDRPDLPDGLERSGRGKHGNGGGDASTFFRGRHGRDGDGAGAFFRGRFGRGHDGANSFFRGRFGRDGRGGEDTYFHGHHDRGDSGQVAGSSL
jgi:hypothetical protein